MYLPVQKFDVQLGNWQVLGQYGSKAVQCIINFKSLIEENYVLSRHGNDIYLFISFSYHIGYNIPKWDI